MHGLRHFEDRCGGLWAARRFGRHGGRGFGPGWGPGPGGGGGDWFRVGRMLAQGDLKLLALALIAEQPRHGYELIKLIEEKTSGCYSPSPGVVYPTLTFLEEAGYVTAESDGAKKRYTITEEGRAYLEENRDVADMVLERLAADRREAFAPAPRLAAAGGRGQGRAAARRCRARQSAHAPRRSGSRPRTARPRPGSSRSWREPPRTSATCRLRTTAIPFVMPGLVPGIQ